MTKSRLKLPALDPAEIASVAGSSYPAAFKPRVAGRGKQKLGDALGLTHFGVNVTTIKPGAASALRHWHSLEDEFVYVLHGELVLVTDAGEQVLTAGMAAGFPAGHADAHCLVNRTTEDVIFLEVGDRAPADAVTYPDDDLACKTVAGGRTFTHKDGTAY